MAKESMGAGKQRRAWRKSGAAALVVVAAAGALLVLSAKGSRAQFKAIPNYIGIGAGLQFRTDINNHLSGVTPVSPRLVSFPFARLPAEQDGQLYFCSDCQQTTPCLAGGSGATATGQGGVWTCGGVGALTTSLNANHNRLINVAPNSATGDALSQGQSHLNDLATASGNYSMGSNRLTSVGADTSAGDALSRAQSTLNSLAGPAADYAMNGHGLTGMRAAVASGEPCVQGQSHCTMGAATQASDPITFGQAGAQLSARQPGPTVVSSAAGPNTFTTSVSLSPPANIANGNALLIVASLGSGGTSQTITWPSGFTQIPNSQVNNGSNIVQAEACKIANNESGNYPVAWTNGAWFLGGVIQLSGVTCATDGTPTAAGSGGATSISVPGVATTQTNDLVLTWGSLSGGFAIGGGRGPVIFSPNGDSQANDYTNAVGTTPAVTITSSNSIGMLGEQVAFVSQTTFQQMPILEGGAGNALPDLTASLNGVIDASAPPYNAACDGNTDDAVAIQTALNAACLAGKSLELPSGVCRTTVPIVDDCTGSAANGPHYNANTLGAMAISGRSEATSILTSYFGLGPTILEANPAQEVKAVGPITATDATWGTVACWNGSGTPCGTATGVAPGNYAYDVKEWIDDGAQQGSGCGTGTNPLNGCGPGQFTVQAEVYTSNNSDADTITSSGSGLTGAIQSLDFYNSSNGIACLLNIAGTVQSVASPKLTQGAWHHVACVYDNHSGNSCSTTSCMRLYVDGTQTAALDVSGNIVQPTYDTWWLGARYNHFPNGDPGEGGLPQYWEGKIAYFDLEKADLYPSGTAFTPPASKPSTNGNQMLLVNFDHPATISGLGNTIAQNGLVGADNTPFTQTQSPGSSCSFGGSSSVPGGKCGAWAYIRVSPLLTGEIGNHAVHDLTVNNGGEDVLGSQAIQLALYNLNLTANHVPLKIYNNSYAMYLNNAIISTNGEADIETSHNTGFNHASMIKSNNGTAFEVAMFEQAGSNFYGLFMNPQLGGAVGDIYFGEDSEFTNFTCTGCLVDSENNAPSTAAAWFEGGIPTLIGGDMQSLATGNPPSIQLTGNTTLLAVNTHFEGGSAGGAPIIHFLTPPTAGAAVTLVNPVVNGMLPNQQAVALSDQPAHVNVLGNGLTLSQAPTLNGGLNHVAVNKLADPAAPTIAVVGTTGSTGAGPYYVVCHDANGGVTNVSAPSNTLANAPAALSASSYIQINWTAETGCNSWDVLKGSTGTALATGLNASLTTVNDTGQATVAYTTPARNTTGDVAFGTMLVSTGISWPLPSTVVNGAGFYCPNCDPPANPPVACTSSGTRTGAWVHGLNSQWICTP